MKERVSYFEALKHQERWNHIKKGSRDNFRGWKKLSKVETMYIEKKMKEAKFK